MTSMTLPKLVDYIEGFYSFSIFSQVNIKKKSKNRQQEASLVHLEEKIRPILLLCPKDRPLWAIGWLNHEILAIKNVQLVLKYTTYLLNFIRTMTIISKFIKTCPFRE